MSAPNVAFDFKRDIVKLAVFRVFRDEIHTTPNFLHLFPLVFSEP